MRPAPLCNRLSNGLRDPPDGAGISCRRTSTIRTERLNGSMLRSTRMLTFLGTSQALAEHEA
eukprot:1044899-Prymnesium_polylepis.1